MAPTERSRARTVDVDWADLELAFRDGTGTESYLDRESGEVVSVVAGFADEAEVRERLARHPGRYVVVTPLDASFSREVLKLFVDRLRPSTLKDELALALVGPGGLQRSMALLHDDKAARASYLRFEQSEVWRRVERFLREHHVQAGTPAPALDLFEGQG